MEENKKKSVFSNIMLIIITAVITCLITTIVVYNVASSDSTDKKEETNIFGIIARNISNVFSKPDENSTKLQNKITEIDAKLKETYIGEIDEEKLIDGALEGYVEAIGDEYSEYLTKEEVNELLEEVDGSYVGVGVYISQLVKTNEIVVIGVIQDSPAEEAGILVGDIIKKVDGTEYTGDELNAASNKMRGPENTDVKVTIVRNEEEKEINITRRKIEFKYVSSELLENNIGYIKISSFEGNCAKTFEEKYKELEQKGIKSLIIDLRNNGGGLVDQCLEIADFILPKGDITLITTDKNKKEEISKSRKDPIVNVPVVILVNNYSASASEILTGAIKDNLDAKVVGTTTYGKGVIQGIYLLKDQETGLKVTIQEYFTPKHNKINKTGITPDYEVELPEEYKGTTNIEKEHDTQLQKAIDLLK